MIFYGFWKRVVGNICWNQLMETSGGLGRLGVGGEDIDVVFGGIIWAVLNQTCTVKIAMMI